MHIDLTPEELSRIVQLVEAGNLSDTVNAAIHRKTMQCLDNFKPPEHMEDLTLAGKKWQTSR